MPTDRLLSSARAPVLLWLPLVLFASLVDLAQLGHIAMALAGAGCALSLRQPGRVRVGSALAMAPIAFVDAPAWSVAAAGGLLALALARPAEASVPSPLERIQRHLEWCRRRGDSAHLLWVHAPMIDRETASAALAAFRLTDNPALLHEGGGGEEIVAMVDDANLDRAGLERRLRAHVGDGAGIGWAAFPDDGVTLDTLFRQARATAVASTSIRPERPEAQLNGSIRRWGGRSPAGVPARSPNQG